MAKSSSDRSDQRPAAAVLPGLGSPSQARSLGEWLARGAAGPNAPPLGAPGLSSQAPTSTPISPAVVREALRCAGAGVRLVQEGRVAEGIALLKRSVQLNPGAAMAQHDLGAAMIAAGQPEQAAAAFAAALRLNPSIASAHHALAQILDGMGQEEKAMAGYRAAVALRPNLVAAQLRLGDLCAARGQRIEALAAFRAAAKAARGTLTARLAEARALEASDALDEALAVMRAIVEEHPENAEAQGMLGKLLGEAGLLAEAAAHHLRAAELSPDRGAAWYGVAANRKFCAEDGRLIDEMTAALARPNMPLLDRRSLCFALGKAHDDMGNYKAAMQNFEAGNRLRARSGGLDRDALVARLARVVEATPPGYRDRQPDPGIEDATPVLIVGMPRSGTTLTEQILSSHPEVAAGGELLFWSARDNRRHDVWSLSSTPEATRRLADDYLATLRAIGPQAKRVTDKALGNFMLLGFIHRVFPNATLIHCRRHPIDTALSIFTTNFDANLDFVAERSDLVFYYRQYQRLMAHWREILPPDRFVEVDYEALVGDPEPHARRLVAACGLDWNDACLAPHRTTRRIQTASVWQARQPIYRTSVERWRRYEPWLGELRELAPEA
jgi:tetratricopeptide (TPR) repeat protein